MPRARYLSGLVCASTALLAGCLLGGGSDQPNRDRSLFSGRITFHDGAPAPRARITVFAGAYRAGADVGVAPSTARIETETTADSEGRFSVALAQGPHFLEGISSDSAGILILDSLPARPPAPGLGDLALAEAVSLQGILLSSGSASAMLLAGTPFRVIPDSAGRFRFPRLPPGRYRLAAEFTDAGAPRYASVTVTDLEPGQTLSLDTMRADPGVIRLFDFETPTPFSGLRGLSYPYDQPDNSKVGAWAPRPLALDTEGAFRGKSLHHALAQGASMGFALGEGYYDLSKLAALRFRARGSGSLDILFHTRLVVAPDPSLRARIALAPEWREFAITPADIRVPAGSTSEQKGYTWDKAKGFVGKITFMAADSAAEVWLDELEFTGLEYSDLGSPTPAGSDAYP